MTPQALSQFWASMKLRGQVDTDEDEDLEAAAFKIDEQDLFD